MSANPEHTHPDEESSRPEPAPTDDDIDAELREIAGTRIPAAPPAVAPTPTYASIASPPIPSDAPADPRIAPLQAIFPDFDPAILQSVLDGCNGNQEQAIDSLLGMSDPNYVPQVSEANAQSMTQTELDEQLAHRLMMEEEENAARSGARPRGGQWQPQGGEVNVPYQPRQHVPRRGQQQQQQQWYAPPPQGGGQPVSGEYGAGRTGGELSDQFSRIAETGKKTFNSIFSKVKQKIQELDQPSAPEDPNNQPVNASEWNQWASMTATPAPGPKAPAGQKPTGYQVGAGPFSTAAYPPPGGPPPQHPSVAARKNSVDTGLSIGTSGAGGGGAGPSSPPPAAIDVSRLNLLPKKPVSLVGTSSSGPGGRKDEDEDEDDLEYVENPFEDH